MSLLLLLAGASSALASTVKWVLVDGKPVPTRSGTPQRIVNVINAATRIAGKPYTYGGGHSLYQQVGGSGPSGFTRVGSGYDCSGSVSFALHANGHSGFYLGVPEDSSQFESYGKPGPGKWITIHTNYEHAYLVVAGLRFDTVAAQFNHSKQWPRGDRWSSSVSGGQSDTAAAFIKRHPRGW